MRKPLVVAALAALLPLWPTATAAQSADADLIRQGERVFARCQACHLVDQTRNRVGPHLVGIFGRPAGAVEDFRYSPAMLESGIVWDEETMAAYFRDPRGYIPGNRMAFVGLRQEDDVAAVIAYLRDATATGD